MADAFQFPEYMYYEIIHDKDTEGNECYGVRNKQTDVVEYKTAILPQALTLAETWDSYLMAAFDDGSEEELKGGEDNVTPLKVR